jgi:hypothetical protein
VRVNGAISEAMVKFTRLNMHPVKKRGYDRADREIPEARKAVISKQELIRWNKIIQVIRLEIGMARGKI